MNPEKDLEQQIHIEIKKQKMKTQALKKLLKALEEEIEKSKAMFNHKYMR